MAIRYTNTTLTTSDFDNSANWGTTSLRTPALKWTDSVATTGEYRVELAAGGDASIPAPSAVYAGGVALTAGSLGSLAVSEYAYGDGDTLGYSTVYVRLATTTDPDLEVSDYITYGILPVANDSLTFRSTGGVLSGSDQTALEYDDVVALPECTAAVGTANDYLKLDQGTTNTVSFAGLGVWYLDMGTSGSALVRVDQTIAVQNGNSGLYFKSDTTPIVLFECVGGTTRLVSAAITTLVVQKGAIVYIDKACVIPTIINNGGTIIDYGAAVTTWKQGAGTSTKRGSDAFALQMNGGTFYNDGLGVCTATTYGGVLDSNRDSQTKSLTLAYHGGSVIIGPNVALTDTLNAPVQITSAAG